MKKKNTIGGQNLDLSKIEPLTYNQALCFDSTKNLVLHGAAGTGKTFISCYLAFEGLTRQDYNKVVIIRSAVPSRDIGFLPGTEKEKSAVYEEPYKDIAIELFNRGDAYDLLKNKDIVHFMTTSFIRGITISDCVVIVDECQNMSFQELDSIITRIGQNCRIIFCGDYNQADLKDNGLKKFMGILKNTAAFDFVDFQIEDIVRSGLVKQYLISKYEIENPTAVKVPKQEFKPIKFEDQIDMYIPK